MTVCGGPLLVVHAQCNPKLETMQKAMRTKRIREALATVPHDSVRELAHCWNSVCTGRLVCLPRAFVLVRFLVL